jgi:hypothetical protein
MAPSFSREQSSQSGPSFQSHKIPWTVGKFAEARNHSTIADTTIYRHNADLIVFCGHFVDGA